jgi:hypothetical protein
MRVLKSLRFLACEKWCGRPRIFVFHAHDFLANEAGPNELRTKADVIAFLKRNGFVVSLRESDGRATSEILFTKLTSRT